MNNVRKIISIEIFSKILNFAFLPYFVFNMTAKEFSDFNLAAVLFLWLSIFFGGGIYNIYSSEIVNRKVIGVNDLIIKIFIKWIFFSFSIILISYLIIENSFNFGMFYDNSNQKIYVIICIILGVFSSVNLLIYVYLQINEFFNNMVIFIFVKNVISLLLSFLMIEMITTEVLDDVILRLTAFLLTEIMILIYFSKIVIELFNVYGPKRVDKKVKKIIYNRFLKILPLSIMSATLPFIERYSVSATLNPENFRNYSVAIQIMSVIPLVVGAINQVKLRFIIDFNTNNVSFKKYITLVFLISSILCCIALFFVEFLNYIDFFPKSLSNTSTYLKSLFILIIIQLIFQITFTRLQGIRRESFLLFTLFIQILLLILSGILFSNYFALISVITLSYVIFTALNIWKLNV